MSAINIETVGGGYAVMFSASAAGDTKVLADERAAAIAECQRLAKPLPQDLSGVETQALWQLAKGVIVEIPVGVASKKL